MDARSIPVPSQQKPAFTERPHYTPPQLKNGGTLPPAGAKAWSLNGIIEMLRVFWGLNMDQTVWAMKGKDFHFFVQGEEYVLESNYRFVKKIGGPWKLGVPRRKYEASGVDELQWELQEEQKRINWLESQRAAQQARSQQHACKGPPKAGSS